MRAEQYEVWVENDDKWELIGWFLDFEVASAVFRNRTYRQRLIHAIYQDGRLEHQDILAEVGRTRQNA